MRFFVFAVLAMLMPGAAFANDGRPVGEVSTVFKLIGPNHKIKIAAFEDPAIRGVTCYVSRPVTGGISGAFGVAEDLSDASIACRQTGPVAYTAPIRKGVKGEEVFNERRSLIFKRLHVTRFYDDANGSLVYLTWSDRVVEGSPKNAVAVVTPMPWGGAEPEPAKLK